MNRLVIIGKIQILSGTLYRSHYAGIGFNKNNTGLFVTMHIFLFELLS